MLLYLDVFSCQFAKEILRNPTFYGWLAQFGDEVVIEKPVSMRKSYAKYLQEILKKYE